MATRRLTRKNFEDMNAVALAIEQYISEILNIKFSVNYHAFLVSYFGDQENRKFIEHLRGLIISILKQASEHENGKSIAFSNSEISVKDKPFPPVIVALFQNKGTK